MKLFSRRPFSSNIQIALDGTHFSSYTPAQLTEGISLNGVGDFSKITVKGSSGEENLKNLDVITSAFELKPVYQNISFAYKKSSSNGSDADASARYIVGLNVPDVFNDYDLCYINQERFLLVFEKDGTYYIGIDEKDDISEYNIVLIYAEENLSLSNDIEKDTYEDDDGNEHSYDKTLRVIINSGFYEISDFGKYQEDNH